MHKYSILESILFLPTNVNKDRLKDHLHNKTILITGASSGIGEELAYQLANISCHLILVARRGEKLKEIKQNIEREAAKVSIFQADLRGKQDMESFLEFLHELPNGLDIAVSNAGLSINRSIFDSLDRYHDFTRTMAINYFAPVQLLLSLIPVLRKTQGQIINISTINALLAPVPYFAAYQASKTAFDIWLRSIARELEAEGVSTSTIYLPLVKTPMITHTSSYKNVPAMTSRHAANIICKLMYTKKKIHKPWWLIFGQIASIFLNSIWDVTKKRKDQNG